MGIPHWTILIHYKTAQLSHLQETQGIIKTQRERALDEGIAPSVYEQEKL